MYIYRNQAKEPIDRQDNFVDEFNFGILFTESLEVTRLRFFLKTSGRKIGHALRAYFKGQFTIGGVGREGYVNYVLRTKHIPVGPHD